MTPLVTFVWPDTALELGIVGIVALVLRVVLRRLIRTSIDTSLKLAAQHRAGEDNRADRILRQVGITASARHEARVRTVGSVLRNAVDVLIVVIATLMVLRILGIPLEPVLASAGIGGVALAFGAQSLVKDYLSGMFMIFEDQYGVGDLIDTGDVTGTVEDVGLRVTRLRDAGGQVWYVRNGEILRIGNQSQGWSTGMADIPVAYDEDATRAIGILDALMDEVFADERWQDILLEKPTVAGVNEVRGGAMTIRIFAKCAPNQHWGVQRDILERGQAALRRAGVRGPVVTLPPPA